MCGFTSDSLGTSEIPVDCPQFHGKQIYADNPPESGAIRWDDLGEPTFVLIKQRIITSSITIGILAFILWVEDKTNELEPALTSFVISFLMPSSQWWHS